MYIGHVGIALAGKGVRGTAPLWLLVAATQGCDWVQAVACVTAPAGASAIWSHSIPAAAALALAFSLGALLLTGDRGVAAITGGIVVSHVLADYVTGVKPTWAGGPEIGLNLYSDPLADLAIETTVLVFGWLIYRRSLPAGSRSSRLLWVLLILLGAAQVLSVLQSGAVPSLPKCT